MLLELIGERDYERITIGEITRRADIGQSTFYSHFADKEDLLFADFDRRLLSLAEQLPGGEDRRAGAGARAPRFRFSLPLLRHARSQKRFLQATVARGRARRERRGSG